MAQYTISSSTGGGSKQSMNYEYNRMRYENIKAFDPKYHNLDNFTARKLRRSEIEGIRNTNVFDKCLIHSFQNSV